MKATIRDVAKHAGVSIASVSRVISDSHVVSEETKEKILKSIAELQFTPNEHARSLSNQRKKYIDFKQ